MVVLVLLSCVNRICKTSVYKQNLQTSIYSKYAWPEIDVSRCIFYITILTSPHARFFRQSLQGSYLHLLKDKMNTKYGRQSALPKQSTFSYVFSFFLRRSHFLPKEGSSNTANVLCLRNQKSRFMHSVFFERSQFFQRCGHKLLNVR